jgi:general secretion pathway protein F
LDRKDLVAITESLAALLKAGLTIDRALTITAEIKKQKRIGPVLVELGRAVRAGQPFAQALDQSSMGLPAYYVGMVNAGEVGGSLPVTLGRLAELLRKQHEVRERIRSALIYPAMLAGVVLLTIIVLLVFVLPRFEALFAESAAPLPWSTRTVLAVGAFVSSYWWALAAVAGAGVIALMALLRNPSGRLALDTWLLRSRWLLGLPAAIDTSRLLRSLSTLVVNGIPLAAAMRIARGTLVNRCLQAALDEVARKINAGESTSTALASAAVFPAQAVQLARVGEEAGRLPELLLEAASILELESQASIERLLTLMVPLLTIVMGLLIAAMIGSVLVGLLSINDLAF